jgi:hypothetical protein
MVGLTVAGLTVAGLAGSAWSSLALAGLVLAALARAAPPPPRTAAAASDTVRARVILFIMGGSLLFGLPGRPPFAAFDVPHDRRAADPAANADFRPSDAGKA